MAQKNAWYLFVITIGALLVAVSPTLSVTGAADVPTFVGGLIMVGIGLILLLRRHRRY